MDVDPAADTQGGEWTLFSTQTLSTVLAALTIAAITVGVHTWSDVTNMKEAMASMRDDSRSLMALLPTAAALQQKASDLQSGLQEVKDDIRQLRDQVGNQNRLNDRDLQNLRHAIPGVDQHGNADTKAGAPPG